MTMKLIIPLSLGLALTGCNTAFAPTDTYTIEWQGSKGVELYGSYVASFPKTPEIASKSEQIKAFLPHKVTITLPKDVMLTATGTAVNKPVEVKIYRNGQECGKPTIVGATVISNKTCQ